jgi:hypothetical protein
MAAAMLKDAVLSSNFRRITGRLMCGLLSRPGIAPASASFEHNS